MERFCICVCMGPVFFCNRSATHGSEFPSTSSYQKSDPGEWQWAGRFLQIIDQERGKLKASMMTLGDFCSDVKSAMLTPKALSDFRKKQGVGYMMTVINYTRMLEAHIPTISEQLAKIKSVSVSMGSDLFKPADQDAKSEQGKAKRQKKA